jgi:hypothetical protein
MLRTTSTCQNGHPLVTVEGSTGFQKAPEFELEARAAGDADGAGCSGKIDGERANAGTRRDEGPGGNTDARNPGGGDA